MNLKKPKRECKMSPKKLYPNSQQFWQNEIFFLLRLVNFFFSPVLI